jgi:hypothetical protein
VSEDRSRASKLGSMPAWVAHVLAALGSALAFFVLPRWAPSQLSLDIEAIVLGVVLGIVLGVMLRAPARLSPSFAVGATLGSGSFGR